MKRRNTLISNRKRSAKLCRRRGAKYRASDRGRYTKARRNALDRGVEWSFDFASWFGLWKESGRYLERGRAKGSYQMARLGDCGPYADWNVRIVRMEANAVAGMMPDSVPRLSDKVLRAEVMSIM